MGHVLTPVRRRHFKVASSGPKTSGKQGCDDNIHYGYCPTFLGLGSRRGQSEPIAPLVPRHTSHACLVFAGAPDAERPVTTAITVCSDYKTSAGKCC